MRQNEMVSLGQVLTPKTGVPREDIRAQIYTESGIMWGQGTKCLFKNKIEKASEETAVDGHDRVVLH